MNSFLKAICFLLMMGMSTLSHAQEKRDTLKINPDPEIEKAAKKVGNKTAEIAAKGAADVADKVYKDKVGPGGQKIYIDNRSRYFYINDKGRKVYVAKSQLKDKPIRKH
ncbi:hypothetical protein [Pedobacter sp.]|uniref:hypothetical protein n=1 Tax=Pedobacter sp. TaxID=1411316 RepID=UPI003D7F3971